MPEAIPANDGKADKRCEQEESPSHFYNPGLDPLHFEELGPIEIHFFDGLDERLIQIIRCWSICSV